MTVRITVTWEAIEHAGHGIYDTEYLSYLRSLLSLLPKYGLKCFVAMHQDVVSLVSVSIAARQGLHASASFHLVRTRRVFDV